MENEDALNGNHSRNISLPSRLQVNNVRLRTSQNARLLELLRTFVRRGVHTPNRLAAAGFQYTGDGDTTQCTHCKLQVSNWIPDMDPLTIHVQRMPNCEFVRSIKPILSPQKSLPDLPSSSSTDERISTLAAASKSNTLLNIRAIQDVQMRTFSHWSNSSNLSSASMIDAGFFYCNISDRVICLSCNLICQGWIANIDDPFEVHRTLSPNCSYIRNKLTRSSTTSTPIINDNIIPQTTDNSSLKFNEIVYTAANNSLYYELPKRVASFATWPHTNQISIDDLARAGFFYTGRETIVRCFYCNGSLRNWTSNDNPTIEHARWFPHCGYVKQLYGDVLHRKFPKDQRAQQSNEINNTKEHADVGPQPSVITDQNNLLKLVAERLDLSISQCLLKNHFCLPIIKRCYKDQLKLKKTNFHSDDDLYIACLILNRQIEHIKSDKDKIIIPSATIQRIQEKQISEQSTNEQMLDLTNNEVNTSTQRTTSFGTMKTFSFAKNQAPTARSNPCAICLVEEKCLGCIPCGHLTACVPCGHSLQICPMCRRPIEAFIRIYL